MVRALHYVFKIGNREKAYDFFINILGMKVLRHEEFEEGCKATCNGPYNGKWSKTMVGYGEEDKHFVIELTYNYPIGSYKLGNDFKGIYIESSAVFNTCKEQRKGEITACGLLHLYDPDGHSFFVKESSRQINQIYKISLNTPDLNKTIDYWNRLLGMEVLTKDDHHCLLSYGNGQCSLEWCKIDSPLERGTAFGRIAFAVPTEELEPLEKKIRKEGGIVQTPLVQLDTPGKATVHVVILVDPNEHEICFVGDEGFRKLSRLDPKGDFLLKDAMKNDKSYDWFRGGKPEAVDGI
uniref:VOC domain-containing protein n=1 Tax=Parascaris univalens TaxID=6257 RepID=A0A915C1X3_PARUN